MVKPLSREARLLIQVMRERKEREETALKGRSEKNNTLQPEMSENERARLQAFKNVQERMGINKEEEITKKPFINKDSIIISSVFAILGLAGYWFLMWNFHEIVISLFIVGTLIKFILIIIGKDNK